MKNIDNIKWIYDKCVNAAVPLDRHTLRYLIMEVCKGLYNNELDTLSSDLGIYPHNVWLDISGDTSQYLILHKIRLKIIKDYFDCNNNR